MWKTLQDLNRNNNSNTGVLKLFFLSGFVNFYCAKVVARFWKGTNKQLWLGLLV